jgi:hypothetical protein
VRAAQPDLEVGRCELELCGFTSAADIEQYVGQDRHGVALLDDGLDASEASLKLGLGDAEFHLGFRLVSARKGFR